MIRVVIADDERIARNGIRTLLAPDGDVEVVAECGTGRETVAAVTRSEPDLVFLDVQMPDGDGFSVLSELEPDCMPVVVFTTAYDQYAIRAFEVHAVDYLLKPFDATRFQSALDHAKREVRLRDPGLRRERSERLVRLASGSARRIVVKDRGRVTFVRIDQIDWIEARRNYVRLHVGDERHALRETLTGIESRLPSEQFLRISRSTLVNVDRVREFRALAGGRYEVVLDTGATLNSSRRFRDRLEAVFRES